MNEFILKDIVYMKKLYIALLVVLVLITSTTNVILIYFYQSVNMDFLKNQYHNIYHIDIGEKEDKVNPFIAHLQKNQTFQILGIIKTGSLTINNQKLQIATFTHADTSRFYETNSPITLQDDSVIISNTVSSEIIEKLDFKTKELCNSIYTGDMSRNISFVYSESALQQRNIKVEELSIEFHKHLNWFELHQFKKVIGSYFPTYSLGYEDAFSKKALMGMKNIIIISLLVIAYTAISTFGIYDFLVKEQKRTLRIYLICGLSPQTLRRIFISLIFMINTLSLCISIPISTLCSVKYDFSLEGQLRFLPYLLTSCIIFSISFIMTYYNLNNMFKHDICLSQKQ